MTPKFDIALLDKWIADLNQHEIDKGYAYPVSYDYSKGGKYIKVFSQYNGKDKSVFAFVDADGNIYKPAGWNAPAKGVRARIDDNPPLDGIQLYSSKYLKGAYGIGEGYELLSGTKEDNKKRSTKKFDVDVINLQRDEDDNIIWPTECNDCWD